jgi:hypothetical protein
MSAGGGDLDNVKEISGATDGTKIGNVSDSLKVVGSFSPVPQTQAVYRSQRLLNGSSELMNVNGSVTPVNFDFTPASNETWYLEAINLFFWDSGTTSPTNFGGLAALTNGVQVIIKANGTEYTYCNLQNNMHLGINFPMHRTIPATSGFYENSDIYIGTVVFQVPVRLTQSTADFVRFRVRDNITGLDQFRATALAWRTL